MTRKIFSLSIFAGTAAILAVLLIAHTTHSVSQPSVTMLNIGQGDSFLIESPSGTRMLIDGGRDEAVLSELAKRMPLNDHTIDVVLATHPDADHIGGLASVLTHYKVGLFLTSDVQTDTKTESDLLKTIFNQKIPAYYVRHGMELTLDPTMHFDVLFPDRSTINWETNTASVVGRLQIGERATGTSVLFTGDSPSTIEHYLAATIPQDIDVDMLKLGHHGSKNSSSDEFLKATSPTLALISAGVHNRYGHPASETLARLKAAHIPWVSTQDHGQITFTTDGHTWAEEDER